MSGISSAWRALAGRLTTFKVDAFKADSDNMEADGAKRNAQAVGLVDANIISSLLKPTSLTPPAPDDFFFSDEPPVGPGRHIIAIDVDHLAHLVPSSTAGHHHLYVEIPGGIAADDYFDWLDACAKIGLIEEGYAKASRHRGYTALRLPWVAKYEAEGQLPPVKKPADLIDLKPIPASVGPLSTPF